MARQISPGQWLVEEGEYCVGRGMSSPQGQICFSQPQVLAPHPALAPHVQRIVQVRHEAELSRLRQQYMPPSVETSLDSFSAPRPSFVRDFPMASLPVESFLGPPTTESMVPEAIGTARAEPAEESVAFEAPPFLPTPGGGEGMTFLSAEIDATRSPSAADAVARAMIRGDNIVRGIFD